MTCPKGAVCPRSCRPDGAHGPDGQGARSSGSSANAASGAIRHPDWQDKRIDFQPYPFPSYTAELVRMLKDTRVEGERGFLDALDPDFVAGDLVDDSFVKKALEGVGGLPAFGLPEGWTRTEVVQA